MQLSVSAKVFPEMVKEKFLLAKNLAKVYVYVICI